MAEFVNPYTFVSHVAEPERGAPAGHAQIGEGRFSGVLKIAVTARTPLLIGGFTEDLGNGDKKTVLPRRRAPAGMVFIPGSGLMGAVRSTHEALVGGCMRVLDLNRVPVHRHPPNTKETERLRLAVVTRVDDEGKPEEVALCDPERTHWVPEQLLPGDGAGPVRTGDQVRYMTRSGKPGEFPGNAVTGPRGRKVVRAYDQKKHRDGISPGSIVRLRGMGEITEDCMVVLVTDTNARDPQRPVFFAVGGVGPDSPRRRLRASPKRKLREQGNKNEQENKKGSDPDRKDTWDKYCRVVDGADDLRPEALKKAGIEGRDAPPFARDMAPGYAGVWWPPRPDSNTDAANTDAANGGGVNRGRASGNGAGGVESRLIGRRLYARKYLHVGQPVWVEVDGDGEVSEIRLSQLWRYEGGYPVADRVGGAKGCTDPEDLCWSCRIFGAADTEGRDEDEGAVQNSYRGHVRIDDLLAVGEVEPVPWELAPLASPKPSAGQFYLDNKQAPKSAEKNTRPVSTWGSGADVADSGSREPRSIRGRKFYWRTETEADPASSEPQRGKKRDHQTDSLSGTVELIPAGTRFVGRIAFDNLSAEDYGSLLAALAPRVLGEAGEDGWDDAVISVGGGKPFGFGSVRVDITEDIDVTENTVQTARERYLGEAAEAGQKPTREEAVREFRAAVPHEARANWQALRHALSCGFVDDADVWYPPGGGQRGDEDYDKSFEFFALTNGLKFGEGHPERPLVRLPDAAEGKRRQKLSTPPGKAAR